mmetsp:Transcript_37404/g.115526  ORF Transcript_37404/g.115526 Transcript_37404/m.115526 type:complete len:327 (-) Transcript_37404:1325-2305(-)
MRSLISFGSGLNRDCSTSMTAATRLACSSSLRDFITRTMHASMAGLRSSATVCCTAAACATRCTASGSFIFFWALEKSTLTRTPSVGAKGAVLAGSSRTSTLTLEWQKLTTTRFTSSISRPERSAICCSVKVSESLKSMSTMPWYTAMVNSFVPRRNDAVMTAEPCECTHSSFLFLPRARKKSVNLSAIIFTEGGSTARSTVIVGQKPIVSTCTLKSKPGAASRATADSRKALHVSTEVARSLIMPSSLLVKAAPHLALNFWMRLFSVSSLKLGAVSSRRLRCLRRNSPKTSRSMTRRKRETMREKAVSISSSVMRSAPWRISWSQ